MSNASTCHAGNIIQQGHFLWGLIPQPLQMALAPAASGPSVPLVAYFSRCFHISNPFNRVVRRRGYLLNIRHILPMLLEINSWRLSGAVIPYRHQVVLLTAF